MTIYQFVGLACTPKTQLMRDIRGGCAVGQILIRDRSCEEQKAGTFPEQVRFRQMPRWQ